MQNSPRASNIKLSCTGQKNFPEAFCSPWMLLCPLIHTSLSNEDQKKDCHLCGTWMEIGGKIFSFQQIILMFNFLFSDYMKTCPSSPEGANKCCSGCGTSLGQEVLNLQSGTSQRWALAQFRAWLSFLPSSSPLTILWTNPPKITIIPMEICLTSQLVKSSMWF